MKIVSQCVMMWANFESIEELENWIEAQKPKRVRVILAHEGKDEVNAHLDIEIEGYPMYVSEA